MGHSLTGASDSQICTASGVKNAKISGSVLGFVTVTLHCSSVASAPDAEGPMNTANCESNYTYIPQIPTSPNCGAAAAAGPVCRATGKASSARCGNAGEFGAPVAVVRMAL